MNAKETYPVAMFVLGKRRLGLVRERESRKLIMFASLWELGAEAVAMAIYIDQRVRIDTVVRVR